MTALRVKLVARLLQGVVLPLSAGGDVDLVWVAQRVFFNDL